MISATEPQQTSTPSAANHTAEAAVPIGSAWMFVLRQFAVLLPFVGVAALAADYPSAHWAVRGGWVLWTSYFLFCWTSLFHETVHQTLPRPKWFNVSLGRVIGTVLLTPYTVYREAHIRHHAYLNRPNDFELWPYSDPNRSLAFRRAFVWLDLIAGALTSPYIYGRIYYAPSSPIKDPAIRRTIFLEYMAIVAFWGSTLLWIGVQGYWPQFLLSWVIPHALAGVVQTGRKFTEHLGMSSFDPVLGTRTVIGTSLITRLASFLNFEIFVHGPHHRFPRIQHHELKDKMGELLEKEPAGYPVYRSYLAATRAMLPHLFRGPGVGINAGGRLNVVRQDDIGEFIEDAKDLVVQS
jgi:fatty acid desaturase